MKRIINAATTGIAALALSVSGVVAATDAGAAPAKVSKADVSFLKSNEQVNLAEITLGTYVRSHAKDAHARSLARVTVADHKKAQKADKALAKTYHVALPTHPNAAQQKTAKRLMQVHRINYTYYNDQVAGHKLSIAATKSEIAHGSNAAVVKYARSYLPIAQMHLAMAKTDLARYKREH